MEALKGSGARSARRSSCRTSGVNDLEGFLFPNTYVVTRSTSARQIVDRMVAEFRKNFTPELRDRAKALGVWAANWVIARTGIQDPSVVVWDEFVGQWIALLLAPAGWPWLLGGFALFRLFDIWKPFPIRHFERVLKGGFGVMWDDIVAAFYTLLLLALWRVGTA